MTAIFEDRYQLGDSVVDFTRDDIHKVVSELGIEPPRNIGDVLYSFRYRTALPDAIRATAPSGQAWIIRPAGTGVYRLVLVSDIPLTPNANMVTIRVPDATPGIITKYSQSDEQAVLARVRYNRLIDVFLGLACYSLQNHLRTAVPGIGQIETDELYVGLDKTGTHYVIPVQAKAQNDQLSRVQVEQDIALCEARFSPLECRPIGVQMLSDNSIALFEFVMDGPDIRIRSERHYQLVAPDEVSDADLRRYRESVTESN